VALRVARRKPLRCYTGRIGADVMSRQTGADRAEGVGLGAAGALDRTGWQAVVFCEWIAGIS
jgi:hypothetical protein